MLNCGIPQPNMALVTITQERYDKVRRIYFLWKELNALIKEDYTRGINLPEAITEPICCFVNGFYLSTGAGSEDAVIPRTNELVQVKATSNWNSDLTSFGPTSEFDYLHFVRLTQAEDKMYLYDIPTQRLTNVMVNSRETFGEQQRQGRRPRFSIIQKYIIPYSISHYAVVDLRTGEIERL
jgi:hypothetical protein